MLPLSRPLLRIACRLIASSAVLVACSEDSDVPVAGSVGAPAGKLGAGQFVTGFPEGITITTALVEGDPRSADVTVRSETSTCFSRRLTPNDGSVLVIDDCDGHDVDLELQFVSPDGPCHDGSLYITKGHFAGNGRTTTIALYELAIWSSDGSSAPRKVTRGPSPYDAPTLAAPSATGEWAPGTPLSQIGRWTYAARIGVLAPAQGCSVVTNLSLTLQPPASGSPPRTFSYRVEHTRAPDPATGEALVSTVTSPSADAPTLVVARTAAPARGEMADAAFSVSHVEVVAGGSASLTASYAMAPQVALPATSSLPRAFPAIDRFEEIAMTSATTPQAITAHLSSFFGTLLKPATPATKVHIALDARLSTPIAGGFPVVTPIAFIPDFAFAVGADDRSDCAAQVTKSFVCELATTLSSTTGAASPDARYVFDFTISMDDPGGGGVRRVLHLADVHLPLSLVAP